MMRPPPDADCEHPPENVDTRSMHSPEPTTDTAYRCTRCWRFWVERGGVLKPVLPWNDSDRLTENWRAYPFVNPHGAATSS